MILIVYEFEHFQYYSIRYVRRSGLWIRLNSIHEPKIKQWKKTRKKKKEWKIIWQIQLEELKRSADAKRKWTLKTKFTFQHSNIYTIIHCIRNHPISSHLFFPIFFSFFHSSIFSHRNWKVFIYYVICWYTLKCERTFSTSFKFLKLKLSISKMLHI